MKPLRLTLKGFTGIRDGLGLDELSLDIEALTKDAQLIALIGPNGAGKTTIIENLQPHRLMPSRATSASVGGFSYYDHLCRPEGFKELEWLHEGRRLRSQLVFRMNGARRTEAFLHEWKIDRWVPMVTSDGTGSDGRAETYDRCVESLLGSPEAFFTSAFHAQNRRQLSAYRPSEVKSLLVELLGLEQIRAAGQDAGRVAAQLQQALEARRMELARVRAMEQSAQVLRREIDESQAQVQITGQRKDAAQIALRAAEQQLASCEAERAAAASTEALRQSLLAQVGEHVRRKAGLLDAHRRLTEEHQANRNRAAAALREAEQIASAANARHQRELTATQALLARRDAIRGAAERLPALVEQEQRARDALRCAESVSESALRIQQRLEVIASKRQGLEREAGAAVLRVRQLQERFQLTAKVPCSGTELQGSCQLLADAREAQTLRPSAELKVAQLQQEVTALDQERDKLQRECSNLGDSTSRLIQARSALDAVIEQRRVANADAALVAQLDQAEERVRAIAAEGLEVERRLQAARATASEEMARSDASSQEAASRHAAEVAELDAALARLAQQLGALPPQFDEAKRAAAEQGVASARRTLAQAEADYAGAVVRRAEFGGRLRAFQAQIMDGEASARAVAHLETELALWTALSKALGNDGVIALCIDDAGPTLASLANELLINCYGPRFTISITTQVETAKKDLKEGFDVVVFDAQTGASKSVGLMSGGERVLVNEALTRAIAVYLAQCAGRRYHTLFSDETDGPLDAERKRMFVAMKREVLRLAGYEKEIFVSQTPQLWEMADCVIDVGRLAKRVVA
ncbi:MAG TPA: DNA repair protein [Burkholderiaceae bacterium]|nr:DNA repair protein [Burkholderiaceae bacterium]